MKAIIAMAALATALTANFASAATVDDEARTAVVRYSDLDLSRAQDARRLYGRIQTAAREVCENYQSPTLQRTRTFRQCVDKAVNDAVTQVQSAQVTAIRSADIQHLTKR